MLCCFFLLLLLCGDTVEFGITHKALNTTLQEVTTISMTTEEKLSSLQLVASPDYPVAEGQMVHLHCSASSVPKTVIWSWQHLENQTWHHAGNESDLTLSKPKQSGLYRCRAMSLHSSWGVSPNHTVLIISMHPTVGENLGIAAFVLILVVLVISLAVLSWISWKTFGDKLKTSMTATKGSPGPEKSPKGGLQQTEADGDVYINYTNTNPAYSDLDPASMNDDNVYSSLS
ncbi:uncharacterized protein LOC141806933 [Halichoeres trimaculatus]|uniref:uncharacterized protein LOC141806933 n=1 Tax=Halichoeres trimaculatus TaxID=147232 RepID=UPI003D9F73FF